jgi:hypothetical protein
MRPVKVRILPPQPIFSSEKYFLCVFARWVLDIPAPHLVWRRFRNANFACDSSKGRALHRAAISAHCQAAYFTAFTVRTRPAIASTLSTAQETSHH